MASEWLKQRHTPALWLTLLFPLVCMLGMGWYLTVSYRLDWNNMLQFTFGAWLSLARRGCSPSGRTRRQSRYAREQLASVAGPSSRARDAAGS
ncbi:hypothetical protein KSB_59920 [Ktedonobacter robiniae]|uniref:Uncharacterized protein n=1 Tax=Ktedonobacter robiniae TaxID=2778365 RepID=A0ABQ3UXX3_9CHLR|nr:hypothetical protein KSB_59920 [Ktedonobacter robiniae]